MTLVVDASVALKWVLIEDDSAKAEILLTAPMIAPEFWRVEAGNGLWKAVGRKQLSAEEARAGLDVFDLAPVESVPTDDLVAEALDHALRLKHPIYDCLYLALAMRRKTQMVTADDRFVRVVERHPELIHHVVRLTDIAA